MTLAPHNTPEHHSIRESGIETKANGQLTGASWNSSDTLQLCIAYSKQNENHYLFTRPPTTLGRNRFGQVQTGLQIPARPRTVASVQKS